MEFTKKAALELVEKIEKLCNNGFDLQRTEHFEFFIFELADLSPPSDKNLNKLYAETQDLAGQLSDLLILANAKNKKIKDTTTVRKKGGTALMEKPDTMEKELERLKALFLARLVQLKRELQ
jgi:hypothetical protein